MALATLYSFSACVRDPLPDDLVAIDLTTNDFTTRKVVETADKVHAVADSRQCSTLTWGRLPLALAGNSNI